MDVKVQVDAKAIEESVVKAILESALGAHIQKAIDEKLKQWSAGSYWDDGLKKWVHALMEEQVKKQVRERVEPILRELVAERLSDDLLHRMVDQGLRHVKVTDSASGW